MAATCAALGSQSRAEETGTPAFALRFANGAFVTAARTTTEPRFDATLSDEGGGVWRLSVRSKDEAIKELWFPWEEAPRRLNSDPSDDVLYFPHWMGQARDVESLDASRWEGRSYPGPCFAPLVVIGDATLARMAAAVNWPPEKVFVAYARDRIGLRYDEFLSAHAERSVKAMVLTATASPERRPWHALIDAYRTFLQTKMKAEGLYPLPYSDWLKQIHGWQNVQLQNLRNEELNSVVPHWKRYKAIFPWLQMWGQMSDFFPTPGTETGCCLEKSAFHSRYTKLFDQLRPEVSEGQRYGFYCRPPTPYGSITGTGTAEVERRDKLLEWIKQNREKKGANGCYIDVLGAVDFGDALAVAKMFGKEFPADSVIEMPTDVYPAAYLISGCVWGGSSCRTLPGQTPDDLSPKLPCVGFPALGRYLLNDRIFLLGESNGDHSYWGAAPGHDHWTERQAFLLGAKFDAMHISESEATPEKLNHALELILGERDRVDWWKREPVYLDRAGLSAIPSGVDIRRFRGSDGGELLAVDNWTRRTGQFRFLGREVELPRESIRVLVDP